MEVKTYGISDYRAIKTISTNVRYMIHMFRLIAEINPQKNVESVRKVKFFST